ncbi:MAG TPA: hypothetical protein VN673_04665 [Clostridia bacterium]|nr:hypothetical protein [Clostridia bacterium]
MNTDPSPENTTASPSMADLLADLRETRQERFSDYLIPLLLMAGFGCLAWKNGQAYAGAFLGALTVVFTLHAMSQRRNKRQIDLLVALLAQHEKRKQQ